MASIVTNQRKAFLAAAQDDARRLARSLAALSPAEQAGILAVTAGFARTPIEMVMIGDRGDWQEAHSVIAGQLPLNAYGQWHIGSGCHLHIEEAP